MRANPYPGAFIVIEGIDGSGKTTQIEFIARWLKERNSPFSKNILITHEPFTSEFGLRARAILKGEEAPLDDPLAFQELYVQDRKRHLIDVIIPYVQQENALVLCDRYFLSTFVYGIAQGIEFNALMRLHERILGDQFILPDATFIMEIDSEMARSRLTRREGTHPLEYFEKKKDVMMEAARQYASLVEKFPHTQSISGSRSIAEVSESLSNSMSLFLDKKLHA